MKHIISNVILEQSRKDCNIISFLDTSKYLDIEVTNPMLQIAPPNWSKYYNISYNMNAITLIRPEHINHQTLPSGVYHFIQSVCPNDKVKEEFCYLQICNELKCIAELACFYMDNEDYKKNLVKLYDLELQLKMAQSLVNKGEVKKGTELYNIGVKKLNSLENKKDCDLC